MNISPLEQINNIATSKPGTQSPEALRRAAMQFEAVLLMQLTSSLNSTNLSDDEDSLFGSDGGSGLAKQMFSEQLATTMAQSGGIGLADLIQRQAGAAPAKLGAGKIRGLSNAMTEIKGLNESSHIKPLNNSVTINRSGKFTPVDMSYAGDPNDAEIISTFEEGARSEGIEESQKNLVLDGQLVNSTRARIVPNAPVEDYPPNPVVRKAGPVSTDINPVIPMGGDEVILVPVNAGDAALREVSYQMPVKGRVSSGFGSRFHPIDKKMKFHAGLDLAVPTGTSVRAAADGVVKFAGASGGYGNLVILEHPDGRETRYGHLKQILVSEGEKVSAGQQFALSGSTGKSTGPHLHFEVRENGQVVNPLKIMSNVLPKRAER